MKLHNGYAAELGNDVYEACPKAVFAAIAVSALTTGGDWLPEARKRLLYEWDMLFSNGIVPQGVPAAYRAEVAAYRAEVANEGRND